MVDAALVGVLLVLVWAAVLMPAPAQGSASRQDAFEASLRDFSAESRKPAAGSHPSPEARRRRVLGGLLVAIFASLILGLLPTFRIMLVVSLLLFDSWLAVVALIVHERDRGIRTSFAARSWRTPQAGSTLLPVPMPLPVEFEFATAAGDIDGEDRARYDHPSGAALRETAALTEISLSA